MAGPQSHHRTSSCFLPEAESVSAVVKPASLVINALPTSFSLNSFCGPIIFTGAVLECSKPPAAESNDKTVSSSWKASFVL